MVSEQESKQKEEVVQGVEEEAWLRVIEVATLHCLPMAIKAAINLNVMQILAASQPAHLSAAQIVARTPADAPKPSASLLDRILRLLAGHGILSSSLQTTRHDQPNSTQNSTLGNPPSVNMDSLDMLPTRAYGINSVSHYFVAHDDSGPPLSPYILMHQDQVCLKSLLYIEEALLDGGEPFTKAHGMNNFLYNQHDARFDKLFNLAMHNHSQFLVSSLVDTYDGFQDLHSLVDVGGGLGVTLRIITSKHPHIHGINFDQPHIIAKAPPYNGVEHVAGDMFVNIPKADAAFMKFILHDWDDNHCKKFLQNCYQALPSKGKVIVVDVVLPIEVDSKLKTRIGYQKDLLMFTYNVGGKERTIHELKALALCVGFSNVNVICEIQELTIVEIYKS